VVRPVGSTASWPIDVEASRPDARRPRRACGTAKAHQEAITATTREAARIRERLVRVQDDLKRARTEVRVLREQVDHLQDVADQAETQALVAETPLADRGWNLARKDRDNHVRLLEETRDQVERLAQERDRLLDELLDAEGTA